MSGFDSDEVSLHVDQPDAAVVRAQKVAGSVDNLREQAAKIKFAANMLDDPAKALLPPGVVFSIRAHATPIVGATLAEDYYL